jgi:hypothetical protein
MPPKNADGFKTGILFWNQLQRGRWWPNTEGERYETLLS